MTQIIEQISVAVILMLLAVKSVVDVLEYIGLPVPFLERKKQAMERQKVRCVLQELGLLGQGRTLQQVITYTTLRSSLPIVDHQRELARLIRTSVRDVGEAEVGYREHTRLRYYIDLKEVACEPELNDLMAKIMANFILTKMRIISERPICFNKIAAPKAGNPALVILLSRLLGMPYVFVDINSPLRGDTIDGRVEEGDEIVIVHDVVASGYIVSCCASEIRKRNGKAHHVFVLVERTDRQKEDLESPRDLLQRSDLMLHSVMALDDEQIDKLLKTQPVSVSRYGGNPRQDSPA